MKIITETKAYVQRNDLAHLIDITDNQSIPPLVMDQMIKKCTDFNRYDFLEFEDVEAIEFIRKQAWILDYIEIKDLTISQIIELGMLMNKKHSEKINQFTAMTQEEKQNNIAMVKECGFLQYRIYSLRDFLWFRQGQLKMKLPKEIKKQERFGILQLIRKKVQKPTDEK